MRLTVLAIIALIGSSLTGKPLPADIVFKNANVYTVNEKRPRGQEIAVKGDRIIFVGSDAQVSPYQSKNTRVIDLKGATVVPGLTDAHYHLSGVGAREITLNLEGVKSLEEFLARVKDR